MKQEDGANHCTDMLNQEQTYWKVLIFNNHLSLCKRIFQEEEFCTALNIFLCMEIEKLEKYPM